MLLLLPSTSIAAVSMGTVTIKVGEEYHADARYSATTTIQQGTWSKSNSNIVITARGNASCTIRGNKVGTARLSYSGTAAPPNSWTTYDIDCYWTINVVTDEDEVMVTSLSLDKTSATVKVNDDITLWPQIIPSNATNKTVSWTSSNSNVARVTSVGNNAGVVYGKSEGTATITCKTTDGSNLSASCQVTVEVNGSTFYYETKEGVLVKYQVIDDKAKTCRVYKGRWDTSALYDRSVSGTLTIPQYADGYKVIEICDKAFARCDNLTSVVFPEGVETIGESIFSSYNQMALTSVTIPSTLKRIGDYAFSVNTLATINGPMDQLEYIGGGAFYNSAWYKTYLESQADGAVYIGKVLYDIKTSSSYKITDRPLVVKDGTTMISGSCFWDQHYYTDLTIPASTVEIEINENFGLNGKFNSVSVSSDNPVYDSRDNCNAIIETATNTLIVGSDVTIIPETVTGIGQHAFNNNTIQSIVIPDAVDSIGEYAFQGNGLESVFIGEGVKKIGQGAFFSKNLLNVTSKITNPTPISNSAFKSEWNNPDSLYIYENATLYVPVGTKDKYASTDGWKRFKNIVEGTYVPDHFTAFTTENVKVEYNVVSEEDKTCEVSRHAIDNYKKGCVTIPAYANGYKVVKICKYAFEGLDSITYVDIPATVVTIGDQAFWNCGIDSVNLPPSVDSIGSMAFQNCPNLREVTSLNTRPLSISKYTFNNQTLSFGTLFVPSGTKPLYETTDVWKEFKTIVEIGGSTLTGDLNSDGIVNGSDLVTLANIILNNDAYTAVADLNADGAINGSDYVALANIILGGNNAKKGMLTRASSDEASISVEPFSIKAGEEKELILDMTNPNDNITLVQFDMVLPEGLTLKQNGGEYDIDIAGRTTWRKHTLAARDNGDFIRFLLASQTNAVIEGTEGAIIKMTLVADNNFNGGSIQFKNILLVTPDVKETKPADFEVNTTTGIKDVRIDTSGDTKVFDLQGRRLTKPVKGISIINGKKVVVK